MPENICPCRIVPSAVQPIDKDRLNPNSRQEKPELADKNIAYSECCEPYHKGVRQAQDAQTFMRSRYSAFVKQAVDYIIATTLPVQQSLLDRQAIENWAKDMDWAGLEIVEYVPKLGKRHAQVAFKAYYREGMKSQVSEIAAHQERSIFVQAKSTPDAQDKQWYFLDPTVGLTVTQKQPCICGSGEKFKRCCGPFVS